MTDKQPIEIYCPRCECRWKMDRAESEWISVKDRLPQFRSLQGTKALESEYVLIYAPSISPYYWIVRCVKLDEPDNFGEIIYWDDDHSQSHMATHWMPLPKVPDD